MKNEIDQTVERIAALRECEICDCVTITNIAQQTLDKIGKE